MKRIFVLLIGVAFTASCSKYVVESPDNFEVTVTNKSYRVGEDVKFLFTGKPDYISFYSGMPGNNYEFRTTRVVKPDSVQLEFTSVTVNAAANLQPVNVNKLSLLVSTDFSGVMDSLSIRRANWRDITDAAKWATNATNAGSGILPVEQYREEGKPVYFAFRYVSDAVRADYLPRRWQINRFALRSWAKGAFNPLAGGLAGTNTSDNPNFSQAGFDSKSLLDNTNNWVYSNTNITFNAPGLNAPANEDWSITRPFDFTIYVPDVAVSLQTPQKRVLDYTYVYTRPGTYQVTFVAKNQSAEKVAEVVRTIQLTITP